MPLSAYDNLVGDFGANYGLPTRQRTADPNALPPLTPDEETSALSRIGSGALHGLGYIGSSIGKVGRPFRALAGMLTGKDVPASELLSWVPFSDAMTLTNPENEVRGSDLLGGNKDTSLFSPEGIGGLGLDIALDPLTYLSFGGNALTSLGKTAAKVGALPKTAAGRLAGLAAASPEAETLARAVKNVPVGPLAPSQIAEVAGQRLGGHVGFGFPFMGNNLGTYDLSWAPDLLGKIPYVGPAGAKAAAWTGDTLDPFRRGFNALFDKNVRGQMLDATQQGARTASELAAKQLPDELLRLGDWSQWAMQKAGWTPGKPFTPQLAQQADDIGRQLRAALERIPSGGMDDAAQRIIAERPWAAQGIASAPAKWTWADLEQHLPAEAQRFSLAGFDPEVVAKAREIRGVFDDYLASRQAMGFADNALDDTIGFAPRQGILTDASASPRAGKSGIRPEAAKSREFRGLFTEDINRIALDDALRQMKPEDAANHVLRQYMGWTPQADQLEAKLASRQAMALSPNETQALNGILQKKLAGAPLTPDEVNTFASLQSKSMAAAPLTDAETAALARMQAARKQADVLAGWARGFNDPTRQLLADRGGYFVNNVLGDTEHYIGKHVGRVSDAQGTYQALAKMIQPGGDVPIKSVLEQIGLSTPEAESQLARAFGGAVPADAALTNAQRDAIVRLAKPGSSPEGVHPFLSLLDSITNLTKAGQTAWPQTQARNFWSDLFTRWGHGGEAFSPLVSAKAIREGQTVPGLSKSVAGFAGMTDEQATQQLLKEMYAYGTRDTKKYQTLEAAGIDPAKRIVQRDMPVVGAPSQGWWSTMYDTLPGVKNSVGESLKPWAVRGFGGRDATANTWVGAMQGTQSYLEEINRIATYLNARQRGYNPAGAYAQMVKAHHDFGNLTGFERDVMRRIVPFYSWSRQNLPVMATELATNPGGRIGTSMRLVNAAAGRSPGFIPESVSQTGTTVPIGGQENGRQTYLSGLGMPYEDLAGLLNIGQLMGQTSPFLRVPYELATGNQAFTGRDIPANYPYAGPGASPVVNSVLMNSPLSRAFSYYNAATSPSRSLFENAVQFGLGPRLTTVDVARAKQQAVRNEVERVLRAAPEHRAFERLYVPADQIGSLNPSEELFYRLYRQLGRPSQAGR